MKTLEELSSAGRLPPFPYRISVQCYAPVYVPSKLTMHSTPLMLSSFESPQSVRFLVKSGENTIHLVGEVQGVMYRDQFNVPVNELPGKHELTSIEY